MTDDAARRAVVAFAQGDYDTACSSYREVLDTSPEDADAWNGLVMTYYRMERYEDALEAAQHLLGLDDKDLFAWTNLSLIYQRLGRIEDAEEAGARARVLGWSQPGGAEPPD